MPINMYYEQSQEFVAGQLFLPYYLEFPDS